MRWAVALVVLASAVVALPEKVQTLDDGHAGGLVLGEAAGVLAYMKLGAKAGAKKMWGKMAGSTLPPGTVVRKTITNVEKHGKCRFECYKDHMCGGYAFVMAEHECKLLSAPNFLTAKAGNDHWHMLSAETTGAEYKADELNNENKAMKKQISKEPKVKSNKVPKKTDEQAGHLPMNLQGVMNDELEALEEKTEESGLGKDAEKEYNRYRQKLFMEYYQKSAHEYEIRAEDKAVREANVLVEHRVRKANKETPNNKVKKEQKDALYAQARKEVDNHAVRKYQRMFMKDLANFVTKKLYTEQERLKGIDDLRKKTQEEVDIKNTATANKAKTDGKEAPEALKLPKGPWDSYMENDSSNSTDTSAAPDKSGAEEKPAEASEGTKPAGEEPSLLW
jgi:hypothetical protein